MTTPAPAIPPQPPVSRNCGQATASLVFGIAGFILPVLASIPAIILGHLARGRIRKSGGAMVGDGLAIVGLVLGYVTLVIGGIAVLAAIGFAGAESAIDRARKVKARKVCITLDQGVMSFYDQYGHLPTNPNGDTTLDTGNNDGNLLAILLGYERDGNDMENMKKIRFFETGEAKGGRAGPKDGIRYGRGNSVEGLFDPWGGPYQVILDGDYDEKIDDPFGGLLLRGRRVVTYSLGKNGRDDGGGGDDVKSW